VSKRFQIRVRIIGWTLMFLWFIAAEVYLFVCLLSQQWVSLVGGLMGAAGTFLVLTGYCMLTRDENHSLLGNLVVRWRFRVTCKLAVGEILFWSSRHGFSVV
jgi:hypothetical protein